MQHETDRHAPASRVSVVLRSGADPVQVFVDEANGHGTLTGRRRYPLDRTASYVADGKDAGLGGLEEVGRARQRPTRRPERDLLNSCLEVTLAWVAFVF